MTQYDPTDPQNDRRPAEDESFVRHEERLDVTKERRASGRVRIGKRVVTETVQVPVEVRREVLVYEELPADGDAPRAAAPAERQPTPAADPDPVGDVSSRRARRAATRMRPAGETAAPVTVTAPVADLTEAPTEVVLHEERPVVRLETVRVERVRVVPSTSDADHTVTEPVRREHVELIEDTPTAS